MLVSVRPWEGRYQTVSLPIQAVQVDTASTEKRCQLF